MTKEEKLAKKEAKLAKKAAKAEKAAAKAQAKADKKHAKAYAKFVKDTEKKNAKLEAKAKSNGKEATLIAIPAIDEFSTKAELKAAKKAKKAYAQYVKKIEKKNAKMEKKAAKKGKPFVPLAVLTEEEFMNSAVEEHKGRKIFFMIILILLIIFLVYFIIRYIGTEYIFPVEETTVSEESGEIGDYEAYSNVHEITTSKDYDIATAKKLLQQTIKDNWADMGYSSDVSGDTISFNNSIQTINGADCYMFTCDGKTFAVGVKLNAVYQVQNGDYIPYSFNETDILFD